MGRNAAGLDVSGAQNPNWKGGKIAKVCVICQKHYAVPYSHRNSQYCSLQCVGVSQRGKSTGKPSTKVEKTCKLCTAPFLVFPAHVLKKHFCSPACQSLWRKLYGPRGAQHPSWQGGAKQIPYTPNFKAVSKTIIHRDGYTCQNPTCDGRGFRLETHHINHDKQDDRSINLITLCNRCNMKADHYQSLWVEFYSLAMHTRFPHAS